MESQLTPPPEAHEECLFFIDDSNIWIEAQKYAAGPNSHMPQLTDSDQDPRLRINIGRLVKSLCRGRNQGSPSFYYGSRPPPNDAVWEAMKKFKFKTKIYDRGGLGGGGREKEVDNSMGADMVDHAAELRVQARYEPDVYGPKKDRTTFVCITGDRDMMPPIRKVLKSGIRVELWAWRSGISTEYLRLHSAEQQKQQNGGGDAMFSVHYINWIFSEVSFTNFYSTRHSKLVDPAKAVVMRDFAPEWFEGEADSRDTTEDTTEDGKEKGGRAMTHKTRDLFTNAVGEQLMQLGKVFYITWSSNNMTKTEATLLVEFPRVADIEVLLLRMRKDFKGKAAVLSWPEYASKFNHPTVPTTETSNLYAPLEDSGAQAQETEVEVEVQDDPEAGVDFPEADVPEEDVPETIPANVWQTVVRSNPAQAHRRDLRHTQLCRDGIRCGRRGDCGHHHTDKELSLFQDMPLQNFKKWKTAACRFDASSCHWGRRCAFAHSQNEAWCLRCRHEGHYTSDCKF